MKFLLGLCQNSEASVEMHRSPGGGHGYGSRRTGHDLTYRSNCVADWMRTSGRLKLTK
jgi:hypothetical protein